MDTTLFEVCCLLQTPSHNFAMTLSYPKVRRFHLLSTYITRHYRNPSNSSFAQIVSILYVHQLLEAVPLFHSHTIIAPIDM
jgi:hypothetical protein